MKARLFIAVIAGILCVPSMGGGDEAGLRARFERPPLDTRILPILHHPPREPERQDQVLDMYTARGFGGMATNVSFDGYVESEENWAALARMAGEAKKRGMALWLYDEKGYPSGNAGGLTMREHPEWQSEGLLIAQADVSGGGPVALAVPPGELVRAAAFPVEQGVLRLEGAADLRDMVRDGNLAWEAPAGDWRVLVFTRDYLHEGTHAAVSLADKLPYINLLRPEPTARFIELTHGAYAAHLGEDLGAYFTATFTDEPSLMSLFMREQPWSVLPWAPNLPEEFARRRGHVLEPILPYLAAEFGPEGDKARYDFWRTVGELVSENYFGQIRDWCRAHGTLSGGHLLMEEDILTHVPLYGDFFRCARMLDAPSMDCLTSIPENVPWFTARLLGSLAELGGHAVTMCETSDHAQRYRAQGDTRPVYEVTEDEIRGTCNHLLLNGITTLTSYYSFRPFSDEQLSRLNEYVGRCATLLREGHNAAEIALVYPVESIWPRFAPSRHWVREAPAGARQVESAYRTALDTLYQARRDCTIVDGQALAEATVENGVLRHGDLAWRVVILPCVDTLPAAAWATLRKFWESGGAIIAIKALPRNSESEFPSQETEALARELFGEGQSLEVRTHPSGGAAIYLGAGAEALLPEALDRLLAPVVAIPEGDASPLRVIRRSTRDGELYFVINDGRAAWKGAFSFPASSGESWDPSTGAVTSIADPAQLPMELPAFTGLFFRFPELSGPRRLAVEAGPLAALSAQALPEVTPVFGKGQYVDAELNPGESLRWRAMAGITKSGVDTFLFLSYQHEAPVDLRGGAYLMVDYLVPPGQGGRELLAILRDAQGVEYYAQMGPSMNEPGRGTACLPLAQFRQAPFSGGPKGALDWGAIRALSFGWGGYTGKEGERLYFELGAPALAVRSGK